MQFKKPKTSHKHQGKTLCRSGFHKWEIKTDKRFDVKLGKLITVFECKRCRKVKMTSLYRLYPLKSPVFYALAHVVTELYAFFIFHNVAMHVN